MALVATLANLFTVKKWVGFCASFLFFLNVFYVWVLLGFGLSTFRVFYVFVSFPEVLGFSQGFSMTFHNFFFFFKAFL